MRQMIPKAKVMTILTGKMTTTFPVEVPAGPQLPTLALEMITNMVTQVSAVMVEMTGLMEAPAALSLLMVLMQQIQRWLLSLLMVLMAKVLKLQNRNEHCLLLVPDRFCLIKL